MTKQNVFTIGLDEFNREKLAALPRAKDCTIHELMSLDAVMGEGAPPAEKLVNQCIEKLEAFDGTIDGVLCFWDFPVTSVMPVLSERFGLPGPDLKSMLKCEHKYWSRLEQSEVTDACPGFQSVDPFDDEAFEKLRLNFPFWLKPIKATASDLGFRIEDEADFRGAVERTRREIGGYAEPFNYFLRQVDMPEKVGDVGGGHCIAEEIIIGRLATVCGYVYGGDVRTYGVVDSIRYPASTSFFRYEFPSTLPSEAQHRMREISREVMRQIGFDGGAFNIEFFYDEAHDDIWVLEINPRISQSHADIFEKVSGVSDHEIALDLALGKHPHFPHDEGRYRCAAKFFLRSFHDGRVERVPTNADLEEVHERLQDVVVDIEVEEGQQLSDMLRQDSYSYVLAEIHVGGEDTHDMLRKYHQCVRQLEFQIT